MQLTLVRIRQFYWVEHWQAWMADALKFKLTDNTPQKNDDGTFKKGVSHYYKEAFWEQGDGSALFLAGLLEEFKKACIKHGYDDFVIKDSRTPNPNDIVSDLANVHASFRYKQEDVIKAVTSSDKGIVKCNTGFGKTFCLKVLCQAYPSAKIVIVSAQRSVINQIYNGLTQVLGKGEVGKLCAGTPEAESDKRVVVSTMRSLMRAQLETCDFLFFDEVHNVGDNKAFQELVDRCGNCRMFGFTASLYRGDGALPLIKGLFGSIIAECTYQEAQDHGMVTPIKAMFLKYPHDKIIKVTDFQTVNERMHYWKNYHRNKCIANFTRELPPDAQTLIAVKTLEHAVALHKFPELATWPIIHAGQVEEYEIDTKPYTYDEAPDEVEAKDPDTKELVRLVKWYGDQTHVPGFIVNGSKYISMKAASRYTDTEGNPVGVNTKLAATICGLPASSFKMSKKEVDKLIKDFADGTIRRVIATTIIKEGVDLNQLRCLIRADGSRSEILNTQIPGRLSRLAEGKDFTLLVDIWDDDNPWVLGRTLARQKSYRNKGWM